MAIFSLNNLKNLSIKFKLDLIIKYKIMNIFILDKLFCIIKSPLKFEHIYLTKNNI